MGIISAGAGSGSISNRELKPSWRTGPDPRRLHGISNRELKLLSLMQERVIYDAMTHLKQRIETWCMEATGGDAEYCAHLKQRIET